MVNENNIIKFKYNNLYYNIPINKPWDVYVTQKKCDDKVDGSFLDNIDRSDEIINYFTLHLTNKCNLNCSYCFEKDKDNSNITIDVLEEFINFVLKTNLKVISIRLFGGEPLLDLDLLGNVLLKLEYGLIRKGVEINYNIFTNGTCINDRALELISKYNVMIFVSIDGCKEMHDSSRKTKDGKETYDIIIKNIKKIQNRTKNDIVVRAVLNPNLEKSSLVNIMETFAKEKLYTVSIEFPWVKKEDEFSLNILKTNKMIEQIKEYGQEYIERVKKGDYSIIGLAPFSKIISRLINENLPLYIRSCCAGVGSVAISTNGKVYPCHAFVGNSEFELGSLENGITNKSLYNAFNECTAEKLDECNKCPIKYFCTKRCPADSFFYNNKIDIPNKHRCLLEQEIFKTSFYIFNSLKNMPNELKMLRLLYNRYNKIDSNT